MYRANKYQREEFRWIEQYYCTYKYLEIAYIPLEREIKIESYERIKTGLIFLCTKNLKKESHEVTK